MSTITTFRTALQSNQAAAPRARNVLVGIVLRLEAMAEKHRSRRALYSLSDEQLKDIGLSRAEAYHEAAKPFWG